MKKMAVLLLLLSAIAVISCKKETVDTIECDTSGFTTSTIKYSTVVEPILSANCYSCHSNTVQRGGVNLQGYANVKTYADNDKLLGTIAHLRGFQAMPQGGAKLDQDKICKIKFWIDNGTLNN